MFDSLKLLKTLLLAHAIVLATFSLSCSNHERALAYQEWSVCCHRAAGARLDISLVVILNLSADSRTLLGGQDMAHSLGGQCLRA
jgi:hypothetical protein